MLSWRVRNFRNTSSSKRSTCGAAQAADALDDVADPRFAAGIEEAGNDAAKIAAEGDRQTPDVQGARRPLRFLHETFLGSSAAASRA